MKKIFVFCLIAGLLCGQAVLWAGEKEELLLYKQVLIERMQKMEVQAQMLQLNYEKAKEELQKVEGIIKDREAKEKEAKEKEAPSKPADKK